MSNDFTPHSGGIQETPTDRTAEFAAMRTKVEQDHRCECEPCSQKSALCPASASSLIEECAANRMHVARLAAAVPIVESECAHLARYAQRIADKPGMGEYAGMIEKCVRLIRRALAGGGA